MPEDREVTKINLLSNGTFSPREVSAKTVGDLKLELDLDSSVNVNVGGTIRSNDYELSNDDYVAYTSNNKVGG